MSLDLSNISIRRYPDPILTVKGDPLELPLPANIKDLAEMMFGIMYDNNGIGLAAQQVGLAKRILVYHVDGEKRVLINPVISKGNDSIMFNEGCLSFPGIYGEVERNYYIEVDAIDENGNRISFTAEGPEAIVIQHEIDHLDGITFNTKMQAKDRIKNAPILTKLTQGN
jgi:peptide deformylase